MRLNLKPDKSWLPVICYAFLASLILWVLFDPGYILALDITRQLEGPVHYKDAFFGLGGRVIESVPYYMAAQLFNSFLPQWVAQKIFLFLILFTAGFGAHKLCPTGQVGKYYAGLLYAVNPYVYVRLLAGQVFLTAGYAVMPLAIHYFIQTLENGGRKSLILCVLFTTAVAVFSLHAILLTVFVFVILFAFKIIQKRHEPAVLKQLIRSAGIVALLFLLLNAYWLTSAFSITILGELSTTDLSLFAPLSIDDLNVPISTMMMYGFWWDAAITPLDLVPGWQFVFVGILFLALYGVFQKDTARRYRPYILGIGVIGIVSIILAIGITSDIFRSGVLFLDEYLFGFRTFRDSHKFVSLLVLTYAVLGGIGCAALVETLRNKPWKTWLVRLVIVVLLLLPLANCFTMFNGFWGQVKPVDYPAEWYEVNRYISEDSGDFNVLFLPWHAYMDYGWLPNRAKRLSSPAQHFFSRPVIMGDNLERGGIYSQSVDSVSAYIEFLLENKGKIDNLGELLAPLNVKYVILINEADYDKYEFLRQQNDLKPVLEKPGITLFQNQHRTARVYGVDSLVNIRDWNEFLELSRVQDVTEHLYLVGEGEDNTVDVGMQPLGYARVSTVKYSVAPASNEYVIFPLSQNIKPDYWEYAGEKPLKNFGVTPAYTAVDAEADIVYREYYRVYLPSYIVSALALTALILWWVLDRRRKAAPKGPEDNGT